MNIPPLLWVLIIAAVLLALPAIHATHPDHMKDEDESS